MLFLIFMHSMFSKAFHAVLCSSRSFILTLHRFQTYVTNNSCRKAPSSREAGSKSMQCYNLDSLCSEIFNTVVLIFNHGNRVGFLSPDVLSRNGNY